MFDPEDTSTTEPPVQREPAPPPPHATLSSAWLKRLTDWQWPIAALVLAAMLLPGLGRAGLLDPWEMDRAAIARRMANAPRVLVAEATGGTLATELEAGLGKALQFSPAAVRGEVTAHVALQQASQRLGREIAHALVMDGDAAAATSGWDDVGGMIAAIEAQNRGMAVFVVTGGDSQVIGAAIAAARARTLTKGWRNASTSGWLDKDEPAQSLGPLFAGSEHLVTRAQLLEAVRTLTPSPWTWPVHKRDAQNVSVPWVDAALTAVSLRVMGMTELGARLAAALLMLLTGLWVVFVARRLWGANSAWLALFAFATMPSTIGFGRILTFETAPVLGTSLVVGALCLGAARVARGWLIYLAIGFVVLLLGQGLTGVTIAAAITVGWLIATAEVRTSTLLAAAGTALGLGLAVWWVLGDQEGLLLRGLRFTQSPFSDGPDKYHRDFAWFVGQIGFASFPWAPAVLVGFGALLTSERKRDPSRWSWGAALLLGLVVPYTAAALLTTSFHQLVLPATGVLALAAASMLRDLLAGRLGGRLTAMFVALATLLLHREISHGADSVTRFFAFDPPIAPAGGTGNLVWPEGLKMTRPLHSLALLAVMAFALGVSQPFATIRNVVARLRGARAAGWTLGILALAWGLDALISMGTKLDVLLKTQSQVTNYAYDRMWVTIQDTRPEVIAGWASTLLLLSLAGKATWMAERPSPAWLRPAVFAANWAAKPAVALSLLSVGAALVLGSGLSKLLQLRPDLGIGQALSAGLGSSAFVTPLVWLAMAATVRIAGSRLADSNSLLAPLSRWLRDHTAVAIGGLIALALAGVGVGASQASGTWSAPLYLVGCWWMALALVAIVAGTARSDAGMYGWPTAVAGSMAVMVLLGPLTVRYFQETQPASDAWKYLARVVVAAPDSGLWVVAAVLVGLNRLAVRADRLRLWLDRSVDWAGKLEQPRWAATAMVAGGVFFISGYAWTLLPGLSLHFSQKHLLQHIAEAGGQGPDKAGAPRTFAHGSSQTGGDNNFYMQALLGGENVAARVIDNSDGGTARVIALPGWDAALDVDHNGRRDQPAWFGLAAKVDGTSVQASGAAWQADAWKGAAVYGPTGQTATVVDSSTDGLTLSQPVALFPDEPTKAWLAMDRWTAGAPAANPYQHAAEEAVQRFVILPRDNFSDFNHAYREAHAGAHISVLDDTSSRLILAANFLQAAQPDRNWLKKALITQDDLTSDKGIRRMFANFDNTIHLVGYKLADPAVSRSQKYRMTLYWKSVRATTTSWKLFMHPHPLHLDRWPLTQPDPSEDENKPCNGCFQTNHWMAGDIIADSFEQEVPLGTNAGPNEIILGWYNPSSDTRLPLLSASGPGVIKHGDNRVTIGQLQVR